MRTLQGTTRSYHQEIKVEAMPVDPTIHESWKPVLFDAFQTPSFATLREFLQQELAARKKIFPPGSQIFAAFDHTPFDAVKVVVIGQDPYHGPGQANGLCFSVSPGIRKPPSLQNIFKELHTDLDLPIPDSGDLTRWADQGVLLLNATLTVEAHKAGSHQKKGWEPFTDEVIRTLSREKEGLIFLLWGGFAKRKAALIDADKHHILTAAHPSPLAAHNGFFGCKHFSQANALLEAQGLEPIDWSLAPTA